MMSLTSTHSLCCQEYSNTNSHSIKHTHITHTLTHHNTGTINAVIITVFNGFYSSIALALTEFENHRTETQFQVSRTIKVFIFQFVTSYFTLFYAAFGKIQGSKIFGVGPDTCMDNYFKEEPYNRNDCMFELQYSVIVRGVRARSARTSPSSFTYS